VTTLILVMAVTGFFYARFSRLEQKQKLADSDAIARAVATYVETREMGYVNVLLSYAGRFRFREAVGRKDRAEALVHLRQLQEAFPELDRPFLVDPAGVLWAAYPDAPQLYGRQFTHRDWYRGVSREWKPYMSDVFEGARDQALVVAAGVPVEWLEGDGGVGVDGLPTWYGTLGFAMRRAGDGVDMDLALTGDVMMPAGGIVVRPPGDAPLRAVVVNGKPITRFTDAQATVEELPARVRLIR